MFGQWASSHTVWRRWSRTSWRSSRYSSPSWARTLIQSGIFRVTSMVSATSQVTLHPDAGGGPALQTVLDEADEVPRRLPVDDPVVERHAHVHHLPHRDAVVLADHDGPLHDPLG